MTVKLSFADRKRPRRTARSRAWPSWTRPPGRSSTIENAERLAFSDDGQWAAYLLTPPEPKKDEKVAAPAAGTAKPGEAAAKKPPASSTSATCRRGRTRTSGRRRHSASTLPRATSPMPSRRRGGGNGLFARSLAEPASAPIAAAQAAEGRYESLTWTREGSGWRSWRRWRRRRTSPGRPRFPSGTAQPKTRGGGGGTGTQRLDAALEERPGVERDGKRLFFGFKPADSGAREAGGGQGQGPCGRSLRLRSDPLEGRAGRLALE